MPEWPKNRCFLAVVLVYHRSAKLEPGRIFLWLVRGAYITTVRPVVGLSPTVCEVLQLRTSIYLYTPPSNRF